MEHHIFDPSFKINAKTAEFNEERDKGDCTFLIRRDDFWSVNESPSSLNLYQIKVDFDKHRAEYGDKIVVDFDNTKEPENGDEGVIIVGYENN
jgi:hypothetical protein